LIIFLLGSVTWFSWIPAKKLPWPKSSSTSQESLVVTPDLEHGDSGISLLVGAHDLAADLCSILIIDLVQHDLNLAFHSKAKAVISEQEIFAQPDCLARMIRTLALGKTYRSPELMASMVAQKKITNGGSEAKALIPAMTNRELDVAILVMKGFNEKQIAAQLGITYATVRTHSRTLRSKFNVSHRSQLVLRLVEYGMDRLQRRSLAGINPPQR